MRTATRPPERIAERLSAASARRVIEPEEAFDFSAITDGQVIPDSLLTVAGLGIELTADQRAQLSREEVASMFTTGIAFEATLNAGFSFQIATAPDLTDPRITYMLHEIGEETRHSRAFLRVIERLRPVGINPLRHPLVRWVERRAMPHLIAAPALLATMILAGEELPDLLQKLASEHVDSDPVLAAVNRYHRLEEARHLAFARLTVGELYAQAGPVERFLVRHVAPTLIEQLFRTVVHPGVYAVIGLPPWRTWSQVHRTPQQRAIKLAACRPILHALVDGEVFARGRIPRAWRRRCQVDQDLTPLPAAPTLAGVGLAS